MRKEYAETSQGISVLIPGIVPGNFVHAMAMTGADSGV